MKVVHYSSPKCEVLIAYTGFGKGADRRDTSEHLVDWLTGVENADFEDVLEVVRDRGSAWPRKMPIYPFMHTFVVVGFRSHGEAVLGLVSNFENLCAPDGSKPASELVVSVRAASRRSIARAAGAPAAVTRERLKALRRTVDNDPLDSSFIRYTMARIITVASDSPAARGFVSPESAGISLLPDGRGSVHFSEPTRVNLRTVSNGRPFIDVEKILSGLGMQGRPLAGMSFIGPGSGPLLVRSCTPKAYAGSDSNFELVELDLPGDPPFRAWAVDSNGTVLATSSVSGTDQADFWLWTGDGAAKRIPLPDVPRSDGGLLDPHGAVYVTIGGHGAPQQTSLWDGHQLVPVEGVADLPRNAKAVAPSGWMAGTAEVLDDSTRADRIRAARWSPDGELEMLEGREGIEGRAVSITSNGTAVVWLIDFPGPTTTHVWLPDGSLVPSLAQGKGGLTIGMADSGVAVGLTWVNKAAVAIKSTDYTNWARLGTPDGWSPNVILNDGGMLGTFQKDGFAHPWFFTPTGRAVALPGYHRHNCYPEAASPDGVLVGYAAADGCSHAVAWLPR